MHAVTIVTVYTYAALESTSSTTGNTPYFAYLASKTSPRTREFIWDKIQLSVASYMKKDHKLFELFIPRKAVLFPFGSN